MHKLEFELKQHTPIIHFQARDIGATLRASEVKPKLDRFILTEIGKKHAQDPTLSKTDPYERGIEYFKKEDDKARKRHEKTNERLELYLIPGQEGALNYKLSFRLSPDADVQYFLPMSNVSDDKKKDALVKIAKETFILSESDDVSVLSPSPYFANEDKAKLPKKEKKNDNGKKNDNDKTKEDELKAGWSKVRLGSLTKSPIIGTIYFSKEDLKKNVSELISDFFMLHNFGARQSKGFGSYTLSSLDGANVLEEFDMIIDRMLFLGVENSLKCRNSTVGTIFKMVTSFHNKLKTAPNKTSEIRAYFHEKRIEWEKPIERELVSLPPKGDTKNYEKKYIRALLGLHGLFDFSQLNKQVKVSHDEIQRFASPILYKPIGDIIFLVLKDMDEQIFDAEFVFSSGNDTRLVSTPKKDEFDLNDFISFVNDDDLIYTEDL